MRTITVSSPASSANLGSGFDVFAIALHEPRDVITLTSEDGEGVSIALKPGFDVPSSTDRNAGGAVAKKMASDFKIRRKLVLQIEKRVPVGVGLGSSAATSAAVALAIDRLFNLGLSDEELIRYASQGELACSGVAHKDNVSAALLGGFVIVDEQEERGLTVQKIQPSMRHALCVVTPRLSMPERKTEYARSILPANVPMRKLVMNVAKASLVSAGFSLGRIDLIGSGMTDSIVEPARAKLIPGYSEVKSAALSAGASGVCISGAGPSMLALIDTTKASPEDVLSSMLHSFNMKRIEASGFVTRIGDGARIAE